VSAVLLAVLDVSWKGKEFETCDGEGEIEKEERRRKNGRSGKGVPSSFILQFSCCVYR